MIKKLLTGLCIFFSIGASLSFASAQEVEIVPEDYHILYSSSPYSSLLDQEIRRDTSLSPFTDVKCPIGTSSLVPDSNYVYSANAVTRYDRVNEGYANNMADWSFRYTGCEIGLDMSNQTDGYYRYSADLYFGLGGTFTSYANVSARTINLKASYTYNSVPLAIPDSESGMHCMVYLVGETEFTREDSNSNAGVYETFNLVHIFVESTFYYDSAYGSDIVFNLEPWFDNNISSLSVDCSPLRATVSRNFAFYANNRFTSRLFGNVDPPVTPTPSPTPYPGQDTQESINAGVQQIVQDLNVYATPVPTPADIELDPDDLESLEALTLPDISDGSSTFSDLWDIFAPAVPYLTMLVLSLFGIMVFLWILEGRWF